VLRYRASEKLVIGLLRKKIAWAQVRPKKQKTNQAANKTQAPQTNRLPNKREDKKNTPKERRDGKDFRRPPSFSEPPFANGGGRGRGGSKRGKDAPK